MNIKKIFTVHLVGMIILSICTVVHANQSDKEYKQAILNKVDSSGSANWAQISNINTLALFFTNPSISYIQPESENNYSWLDFQISSIIGTEDEPVEDVDLADDWSVFSDLMDEEPEINAIQNEIDLLEVDRDDDSIPSGDLDKPEENESIDLTLLGKFQKITGAAPFMDQSFAGQDFEESFIRIKDGEIEVELFSDPKLDYCFETPVGKTLADDSSSLEEKKQVPEIPVYTNKKVDAFIRLYTVKKRDIFVKAIERMPTYYAMVSRILEEYELPQNLIYLAVVESNLNPNARSHANAVGLWQFMSYTGKHYNLTRSWWHDDRFDPEKSTVAAAKYLKMLHKMFDGNWELAMAAYNSGSGTVRRAIRGAKRQGKSSDFWSLKLPRETRGYVPAFYAVTTIFNDLRKYDFAPIEIIKSEQPRKILDVGGGVSLKQLAQILAMEHNDLMELNPRIRLRGLTPPILKNFEIVIPAHMELSQVQMSKIDELKENRFEQWKAYKVREGDTLWSISRNFRIPMSQILANNWLSKKNFLRIGQTLMLPVPSDWTPPEIPSHTELAKTDLENIPGVTFVHVVKKGETLWQISQKYSVSINQIRHWNRRVLTRKYLKIGTELVLKLPVTLASKSM
ncbi:transglycosylase SLT domain-containing protein [bacterium]|nr:transglycosylase SLT domain-containing protein [bacterium]